MPLLSTLADIATIIGGLSVPCAILFFYYDRKKEKKSREAQSFNNLSTEWRDYLKLYLDHAELNGPEKNARTDKNKTANEILISMFESAFFHYTYYSGDINSSNWKSWDRYLDECLKKDSLFFRQCQEVVANQYYSNKFNDLLDSKVKAILKD